MYKFIGMLLMLLVLGGCAGITNPDYDPPVVNLHTFRVLPQESISPRFEVGLRIINPNRDPLNLEGIYYTIAIEGYEILSGVSGNLPIVEPYGETDITLEASANLVRSIRFFSSLLQDPRDSFRYSFNAKLDTGGFSRKIIIQEEGEFNLRGTL